MLDSRSAAAAAAACDVITLRGDVSCLITVNISRSLMTAVGAFCGGTRQSSLSPKGRLLVDPPRKSFVVWRNSINI